LIVEVNVGELTCSRVGEIVDSLVNVGVKEGIVVECIVGAVG
jgi:hypothetical protein